MAVPVHARDVTDMTGRTVHVPDEISRIVSPYRIATKMLLILGVNDRIVGVSNKPSPVMLRLFPGLANAGIADRHSSVEEVLSMRPDIVFTSPGALVDKLDEAGVPVFCIVVEDPDAMIKGLALIADVLSKTERFAEIRAYYKGKIDYIRAQTSVIRDKKKVYFVGARPLTSVGGDFYQHHIITLAGGINVSGKLVGGWVSIDRERLLAWDPDVMVTVSYYSKALRQDILSDKGLGPVAAVKNRQIYTFPVYIDSWDLPSPESILGIMWFSNMLYPDKVDFDMEKETKGFYMRFYGSYPKDEKRQGGTVDDAHPHR